MDLRLSEDQEILVKSAADLLAREAPVEALNATEYDAEADDRRLWSAMAELGWLGLAAPVEAGGGGGSLIDLELLCEVLGRHLVGPAFLATAVVAAAALEACTESGAAELLSALVAGTSRPVLACQPTAAAWDGARVRGETRFVVSAATADTLLVTAKTPEGAVELLAVPTADPGVHLTHLPSMPGTFWSHVRLDGAPATRLGGGAVVADRALTRAAVMQAAWCAGGAAQLLGETVPYVSQRHQFGVPIGSFQAVQHRLADCDIAVAEAETLARLAATQLDDASPTARRMASTAFVRATDAFVSVARSCHQVWGGIGFCTETDVHLFSRRAKAAQHLWGGTDHHLDVVAEEIRSSLLVRDRYAAALARRGMTL